ncbi:MAG: DUF2314 domain-containing protein [Planctomycetota bacterium]
MNRTNVSRCLLAAPCLLVIGSCGTESNEQAGPAPQATTENKQSLSAIASLTGPVTFTLENAEELHHEFPDTFWIPPRERRENLTQDDLVKLIFVVTDGVKTQTERMWVVIQQADGRQYTGILDNDPYSTDRLKAGEPVTFGPQHVIDIYEIEVKEEASKNASND